MSVLAISKGLKQISFFILGVRTWLYLTLSCSCYMSIKFFHNINIFCI